jgi:iron complex outermembrane receptor protein
MRHQTRYLLAASLLAFAPCWAAHAQETPNAMSEAADDASSSAVDSDEIVVTAQKREQNLQDVPVAVSVVTSAALESTGGSQFSDLARVSPALTMTRGDQPGNNQVYLRGVGTFAFSIGVEPSVLTVIDDVAVGLQAQSFGDLADIDRVEVLRGPQSTLFGKAASAGVISVHTLMPTREFTGRFDGLVTDDHEYRVSAGVSGPVSDSLLFRVTGTLGRFAGLSRNLATGNRINGNDFESVRARLLWEPTDNFSAMLTGYYTNSRNNCCTAAVFAIPSLTGGFFGNPSLQVSQIFRGITVDGNNSDVRLDVEPEASIKDRGASLKLDWEFGDYTLTSISAASHYQLADFTDFDNTDLNVRTAFGQPTPGSFTQNGTFEARTLSQEIRLTSPGDGPFEYVVGAYFAANDFTRTFRRDAAPIQVRNWRGQTSSDVAAAFAQGSYALSDQFKLLGGIRFNHEVIRYNYTNYVTGQFFPRDAVGLPGSASDDALTGRVGVQFEPTDDLTLFATWSTGYKGQAFDLTSSFNAAIAATQPIQPETVENWEAGLRARLLDRRIQFNLTAFRATFSNYQQQSVDPVQPLVFVLTNVGSVRSQGIETELSIRATDTLRLSGTLAYVDAQILSFPVAQCYPGQTVATGCLAAGGGLPSRQDLAGARLNNAPEWKGNIAADFTLPVGDNELAMNLSYAFQSKVNYTLAQDPATVQSAYGILNGSIGFGDSDDVWRVTLFARNLLDRQYYANIANQRQSFGQNILTGTLPRDFRRQFGLRVSLRY